MYFMLFTNNIHIFSSECKCMRSMCMHYTYYIHTVHTYMIAICINVYMIMFNVCIMALACFDGYVRTATLIADRLGIALTLITDSCY